LRPGIKRSDRVVIGVEQEPVLRMRRMVVRKELLQRERLEKPAGVSQMPFCGAGFRHGLDHVIFGFQCFAQFLGETPNTTIPPPQFGFGGWDGFLHRPRSGRAGGVRWQGFGECVHFFQCSSVKSSVLLPGSLIDAPGSNLLCGY
jgi:hypothetical protein